VIFFKASHRFKHFWPVFLFICKGAFSQELSIKGKLTDGKEPVRFANLILYRSSDTTRIIQAVVSDSLGNFSLGKLAPDNYYLKTQSLGYQHYARHIDLRDSLFPIEIQLQEDGKLLNGVEISAQKDIIKKTPQGFIINAKDNLTSASGTATDILKNTPSVVVDADGNITVRGKSPLILINGRNSVLGATDRIPASSVESIEIINNPSAQYDADADGGIINIKLKKDISGGTAGSLALGAGYGNRERANAAFGINHHSKKWNLGFNYDNRYGIRTRKANAYRTNFDLPQEYYFLQDRHDDRGELTQNLKFSSDYAISNNSWLNFELIGNADMEDNYETLLTEVQDSAAVFQSKNSRFSSEHVREKAIEFAMNYSKRFNEARRALDINLSSSSNFDKEDTDISTQGLDENDINKGDPLLQHIFNHQNSNISNLRCDYAHPIGKKGRLETGYKGIYRYTDADFKSSYFVNNNYIINTTASNIFHFREQIHAAYAQYRSYTGKPDSANWKYDIGLRMEQVYNHGYGESNGLSVVRQYLNFFPTANLSYYFNAGDFAKISFSRRINRPSLGQLNPYTDITDSLSQHGGNPYLKPELINAAEAGFNKEWKKVSLLTNVFYRYATNIIRGYMIVRPDGVIFNQPVNFGTSTTYGGETLLTVFPAKFWNLNLSASVYRQMIDGSSLGSELTNDLLSYYGKLINNFSLWKGSKLQIIANYNSPIATPQGYRTAVYFADMGFQQKLFKEKGALGITFTDLFNTQRSGVTASGPDFSYQRNFKIDTRAVILTFAYFFKSKFEEEALENKFSND
jgi:outer membrane receptor protein involved in Fe transport